MSNSQPSRHQIRLCPPTGDITARASIPVWVSNADELRQELDARGAKRLLKIFYDALGDSHVEGTWFTLSELCDEHVAWLSVKGEHCRELAYNTN
jgi:hypothetical protein